MTTRNLLLVAFLSIVVVGGGWYAYTKSTATLSYTLTESGDRQHNEKGDYYTIQIVYPDKTSLASRGSWGAEGRARKAIERLLTAEVDAFKKSVVQNLTEDEKKRLDERHTTYSINIGYHAFSSGSFVSYEFEIYNDTGGAHPMNYYKTVVLDLDGHVVPLSKLFIDGSKYLDRVAAAAHVQVEKQLADRAGAAATSTLIAEGVSAQTENFQNFVVDSDRIRIFIPPYQAAAYAAGSFEVQIPLIEIRDILESNVR